MGKYPEHAFSAVLIKELELHTPKILKERVGKGGEKRGVGNLRAQPPRGTQSVSRGACSREGL